jgi:hypothetical protein
MILKVKYMKNVKKSEMSSKFVRGEIYDVLP